MEYACLPSSAERFEARESCTQFLQLQGHISLDFLVTASLQCMRILEMPLPWCRREKKRPRTSFDPETMGNWQIKR